MMWCLTSTCLVREWKTGFSTNFPADWLSLKMVILVNASSRIYFTELVKCMASRMASERLAYSASVDDRAMISACAKSRILLLRTRRNCIPKKTFDERCSQCSQNVDVNVPHHRCFELIVSSSFNQPIAVERGRSHELVGSMVGAVYVHVLRILGAASPVRVSVCKDSLFAPCVDQLSVDCTVEVSQDPLSELPLSFSIMTMATRVFSFPNATILSRASFSRIVCSMCTRMSISPLRYAVAMSNCTGSLGKSTGNNSGLTSI